jgi:hypothetical protein
MIIKIYGERNTGTNYLASLIERNISFIELRENACAISPVDSSIALSKMGKLGWKHRLVSAQHLQKNDIRRESILIITLTKNPYSWLLSLHRRPYAPIHKRKSIVSFDDRGVPHPYAGCNIKLIKLIKKCGRLGWIFLSKFSQWCEYEKLAFSDFIRTKWHIQFNEGCDKCFKNPVQLWNLKNNAYLELAKHYNVLSFTYESLLAFPENTIRKIFDHLGVTLERFENISSAAKKEDDASKNYSFYRNYYLGECWKKQLSKKDIQYISSQLDPAVMRSFGYKFL